jgi:EAL domain-containing protein (putative c-di-GMP-specific phosphodiesterase class I)/CRP-like cAMP-binding protein
MVDSKYHRIVFPDETVFAEGDRGDCAYIVESGCLRVFTGHGADRRVLANVGAGSLVGEMALIDDQPRTASVVALEPSRLRIVTREYLDERFDNSDPMLRHILRLVVRRFREVLPGGAEPAVARTLPPRRSDAALPRSVADHTAAVARLEIRQELEAAIELKQFTLHYQPIVRLRNDTIAGFEALIRWNHPRRGLLPPVDFIEEADASGLIMPIGHWIVETAVTDLVQLAAVQHSSDAGTTPLFMTVNLSGHQFGDPQLLAHMEDSLTRHHVHAHSLMLEITESSLVDRLPAAAGLLERAQSLGARLSVDDFGTGSSALSYLYRLPVNNLKLARSFVQDMAAYPASRKIVRAVAALAHDLDMETVAEGVENAEQAAACRSLDIGYAQGFHYAPAMPLDQALEFLRRAYGGEIHRKRLA